MVASKAHVFVLPFPVQSHINPMLEFSKCLASNDLLKVTFIMTTKLSKSMPKIPLNASSMTIESISDGSEEVEEPQTTADLFRRLREAVSKSLTELIEQETRKGSRFSPKLLVYDSVFPWMLDIAHQHGMLGASFFTQSCGVTAIYYHIKQGLLRFPFEDHLQVELPLLPPLGIHDLPLLEKVMDSEHTMLKVLGHQFSNLDKADFVLFNTFHNLENEVLNWMTSCWATKTIGPTNLLQQKDTNHSHKQNSTINLFEPNQEACTKWLDSRETDSVVHVSFGSLVSLDQRQMEELAWGLLNSKCWFLWVVRASEEHKLPPNLITSLTTERGLIVNWCSQTEVLAHRAVSCFLTHGGWNSTLEGLSYGVPLIVMPHWVDQSTNGKFVEDVWRVGVRVRADENGTVSRDEVCACVREVGQGERGKELRRNACKWKKLAMEAVDDGGTSSKNIEDIVSRILSNNT